MPAQFEFNVNLNEGITEIAVGKLTKSILAAAGLSMMAGSGPSEKWDMPMAYSATNFPSATGAEFARCVTTGAGGELEIVTHPSGSLFTGSDIKRAVQTAQARRAAVGDFAQGRLDGAGAQGPSSPRRI